CATQAGVGSSPLSKGASMEEQTPRRRHVRPGVAAAAALVLGLAAAAPASAQQAEDFEEVRGNPTCEDIQPDGEDWTELKVDPPDNGEHSDGTLTVQLTIIDGEDGELLEWSSNIGVDAVIVKGGPNANAYFYDPEATEDSGLHAPLGAGPAG